QSSNQAIKQRYHNFYPFYKNLFKNPLLFIIPLLFLFYSSFIPLLFPLLFLFYSSFIPLLFLFYSSFIPSFINPFINPHRNIFQPFDSISPIFKPVGLTELNSIQGEDDGKSRSGVKKTLSNFSGC
ncbi:hypothetical protein ACQJ77_06695, partial [Helicobacter pylori]